MTHLPVGKGDSYWKPPLFKGCVSFQGGYLFLFLQHMGNFSFNHQVWLGQHSEVINLGQNLTPLNLKWRRWARKDAQHDLSCAMCYSHPLGETMVKNVRLLLLPTKLQDKLNGIHACSNHFSPCIKLHWMFWEQKTWHFKVPQHQFIDCSWLKSNTSVKSTDPKHHILGGGFKYFYCFLFSPQGKWSNLTSISFRWVGSTTNYGSIEGILWHHITVC